MAGFHRQIFQLYLGRKKIEKTRQVIQTGEHAWQTVFHNSFNESSDVQTGEFILFVINKFKFLCYSFTIGDQIGGWQTVNMLI